MAICFPRVILYAFFFSFLTIYGCLGVGVLDWGFRVGISVNGVWGPWCEASWVLCGWGSHRKTTLGKILRPSDPGLVVVDC